MNRSLRQRNVWKNFWKSCLMNEQSRKINKQCIAVHLASTSTLQYVVSFFDQRMQEMTFLEMDLLNVRT